MQKDYNSWWFYWWQTNSEYGNMCFSTLIWYTIIIYFQMHVLCSDFFLPIMTMLYVIVKYKHFYANLEFIFVEHTALNWAKYKSKCTYVYKQVHG